MQTTKQRNADDAPYAFKRTRFGRVLAECEVRSGLVVVTGTRLEHPAQTIFTAADDSEDRVFASRHLWNGALYAIDPDLAAFRTHRAARSMLLFRVGWLRFRSKHRFATGFDSWEESFGKSRRNRGHGHDYISADEGS